MDIDSKPSFKNKYNLVECISSEKEGSKPTLYNESAIVNLLEDTGIGRPSTYASIISTLDNRNYTVKKDIKLDDINNSIIHLSNDNKITQKSEVIKGKIVKQRIQLTPLGKKFSNIYKIISQTSYKKNLLVKLKKILILSQMVKLIMLMLSKKYMIHLYQLSTNK